MGFKRFIGVMETEPEIVDRDGAVPLASVRGDIEFRDVSFAYNNGCNVLDDVSIP